jgi:hypothetical protein
MHEHDHAKDPANAPAPVDAPHAAAAPRRSDPSIPRLQPVDPAMLRVPTLAHLGEHPALGAMLSSLVDESLRAGRPFPHTLLSGPGDTSKRVIAHAVAAEMAVPIVELDLSTIRTPQELHDALLALHAGTVLLVTRAEHAPPGPLNDLANAFLARRPVLRSLPGACYEPFTAFLATRLALESDGRCCTTFSQRFFLARSDASETARLSRVLRRIGLTCRDDAVTTLAAHAVRFRLRTLDVARAVAMVLERRGTATIDAAQLDRELWDTLGLLADPKWVRRVGKREAKARAAAEAAKAAAAGTPAAAPATAPTTEATTAAAPHPVRPHATDGGGLANAA